MINCKTRQRLVLPSLAFTSWLALLFPFSFLVTETNASATATIRALFVGNSYIYADDIPWTTMLLVNSKKERTLEVQMIASAGASLQRHWESGEAVKMIRMAKWDYVVLQEQSIRSIESPDAFRKYARLFDHEIAKSGAKTVLFLTWPRQQHSEHLSALTNVCFNLAMELKAMLAPVGLAWSSVLNKNPSIRLFHEDGSHPSPSGSYLAACVVHSVFLDQSPVGLPRTLYSVGENGKHVKFGELDPATAKLIQSTAWQCVQNSKQFNASALRK